MAIRLGKYLLRRKLGAGGMGEVWEAVDTVLDRLVAMKLLAGDGPDAREAIREAAAAARVNHPNAVTVYDVAECDGRWLIVMELVNGPSVARRVEEGGPLPWAEATRIARDAAAGLAAVHAAGLVHRDVKPANILLTPDGTAKVADFGLARTSSRTTLTAVVGTPHYMSPEQCWNELADARADVYSLGATFYTLLTARPPFTGETHMAVMYAHCHSPVPDPRAVSPDVPDGCVAVVRRAMAKAPAERFASADEMRAALDALLAGASAPTPDPNTVSIRLPPNTVAATPLSKPFPTRRVAITAGVGALGAASLTAFACWPRSPDPPTPPTPAASPPTVPDPQANEPAWANEWFVGGDIQQVAVSPDGRRFAVSTHAQNRRDELHLRTRDGKSVADWPKLAEGAAGLEGVAFSPDGKLVASASRSSGTVLVVDVATGNPQRVDDSRPVPGASHVAFSSDGTRLAVGGYNSLEGMQIHFWERQESGRWKKLAVSKPAPEYELWGMAFVPGRNVLAVGLGRTDAGKDVATLRLYDAGTGDALPPPGMKLTRGDIGPPLAFTPDGSVMVIGTPGQVHRLRVDGWSALDPPLTLDPNGKEKEFWAVAVSPDGKWVAGGQDVNVHVWRTADGVMKMLDKTHPGRVHTLAFTGDGKLLSGGGDGMVLVHDYAAPFR